MIRAMYSAISGLRTHQIMLDVTANNLANVNTVGYKSSRTTFKDQLQQTLAGGSNAAQVGLGVGLGSIDNLMTGGARQTTGNPLDVAIQGDGWFQVGLGDPEPAGGGTPAAPVNVNYTRAGNFIRNDKGYLTTSEGYYVMADPTTTGTNPRTGAPGGPYIEIPEGASAIAVGGDGTVSYLPDGGGTRVNAGTIQLAKFANDAGLLRQSGNRWIADPSAGAPIVGVPNGTTFGNTLGGELEMSNVDLAQEFTNMIVAQRGFQANSKVISTSDQMLQDLVNLKN